MENSVNRSEGEMQNMTDCIRPVFLSLDDTRFDDTLIMTEYRLNTLRPGKLADLDVSATQKVNDDRGVTFQLPPSAQAN